MKSPNYGHAIGIPLSSVTYAVEGLPSEPASPYLQSDSYGSTYYKQNKKDSIVDLMGKISKKVDNYLQGLQEHVTLGPRITETMKGKLRLGARILQAGGKERVFKQAFSVEKGEKLLKAFQCYLSTTAGPIAGMLFISTEKIAFHSDRSLALTSPKGDLDRVPYKVLIPLRRVRKAISSENLDKPNQKYIQIVTVDDFEFWFMGFIRYERSFKCLQLAISELQ